MSKQNLMSTSLALTLCVMLIAGTMAASLDYDNVSEKGLSRYTYMFPPSYNIRDLYELLMRNEGYGPQPSALRSFGSHQMERKGGRAPTLRLRFGKRSDPVWLGPSQERTADDVSHA